jgi:hypothetical protein
MNGSSGISGPFRNTGRPGAIRASLALWWLAIGMALVELAVPALRPDGLAVFDDRLPELAVRGTSFGLLFLHSIQMAKGRNWARVALTLIFGGLGTLSLIMEPAGWIISGGSVNAYLAGANGPERIVIVARTLHLLAVLVATTLMYGPASRRYFRAALPKN